MNNASPTGHDDREVLVLERSLGALTTATGIQGTISTFPTAAKNSSRSDAELELHFEKRHYPYLIDIKHIDRVATLQQVKQRFSNTSMPCILASPFISPALAEKCRELDLQFMDTAGNAYLRAPGLFVFIKGQRPSEDAAATLGSATRLGGANAARLAFVLLCVPELLNAPYRTLSQAAGIALGAVGTVLNDLAKRGFITNNKSSRRFLEQDKLMEEWVATFPLRLRPKLLPRRFHASTSDWWKNIAIGHYDAAWGGEVAADRMIHYLKPEKITIYMQAATMRQNLGKLVIQNKLRADPEGEIEILEQFWDLPPSAMPKDCVPPLLAYADLVASMEPRNLEAASRLYRRLKHDK